LCPANLEYQRVVAAFGHFFQFSKRSTINLPEPVKTMPAPHREGFNIDADNRLHRRNVCSSPRLHQLGCGDERGASK
jgi:hypothetical protein